MGLPAPSPEQEAALEALKSVALAGVAATPGKIAAIQSALDAQQEVEDFQKETFDTLNDEIIRRYEVERKWLDGKDITAPVVEADIQAFAASDDSGRLWNGGDFAPTRIPEFDGGPLVVDVEPNFEQFIFTEQDTLLDSLVNGFPNSLALDNGANILNSIDDNSTTLNVLDNLTNINIGDSLVVSGGGFTAVVQVDSIGISGFCEGEPGGAPFSENQLDCEGAANGGPGTWTPTDDIGFTYLVKPGGTIPALSDIGQSTFGGFNNTERTNKVASNSDLQPIMDTLLSLLNTSLDRRKISLQNQVIELQANQDDNLDADAETEAQASITAVDGFLGITPPSTIDISDTGITAFDAERDIRLPQVTQRITDIGAAILFGESGSKSYFDARFENSEGRCRLNNGSIVLVADLTQAKADIAQGGVEAAGLASRYDDLIP